MYESRLYRWLSPDPLAGDAYNPQSLNRYAYVLNNPARFIDPLGLDEGCTWVGTTLTCPGPPPIPTVSTDSSSSAASSVSLLPLDRSVLQWNRTTSIYIQLERAMASERERRNTLTPERIAALGLGPHVEQKDPEQAYKQCVADFKATTAGKVVEFGSLLSFHDDFRGTAKAWLEVFVAKGGYFKVMELGGQYAAGPAVTTTVTTVVRPVVAYTAAAAIGAATMADLNVRSTCSAVAHGWPVYDPLF